MRNSLVRSVVAGAAMLVASLAVPLVVVAPALPAGASTPLGKVTAILDTNDENGVFDIATGPDGNLWVIRNGRRFVSLSRLTTAGTQVADTLFGGSFLSEITAGSDGNMWTSLANGAGDIVRIRPDGVQTTFSFGGHQIVHTAAGPGGNMWVSMADYSTTPTTYAIGRITPDGVTSVFTPPGLFGAGRLTAGADGNMWFGDGPFIGRVTPSGDLWTFSGVGMDQPDGIAAGPDGNVWFTNRGNGSIGRITPAGAVTTYDDARISYPGEMITGPDGNLWFLNGNFAHYSIGRITTAGVVSIFSDPRLSGPGADRPLTIAAGPDGNVWFSAENLDHFGFLGTVGTGLPSAPAWLTAQPGNLTATLSWVAPAANGAPITGYVITPYVGATALAPRTFTSTATNQVLTGLTNGTTYTFKVAAINAVGTGPVSTSAAAQIGTPTSPAFPTAQPGNLTAKVFWLAPAANGSPITGYVITPYVGATALAPRTFTSTATSQVVTGLTNGTTYTFKVAAKNAIGTGPASTTAAIEVGTPTAPTGIRATPGVGQVTVAWTAPAPNAAPVSGYVITPSVGGIAQPSRTFASTATTQVVTGLTSGTAYTFRVAASNAIGTGPSSAASPAVAPT